MARKTQGCRPSISSYMYGNALAIAEVAALAGKPRVCRVSRQGRRDQAGRAIAIVGRQSPFFQNPVAGRRRFSDAREAIGFIPWYFELPNCSYEDAWRQLIDPNGFSAPFGITTAERDIPNSARTAAATVANGMGRCGPLPLFSNAGCPGQSA